MVQFVMVDEYDSQKKQIYSNLHRDVVFIE